MIHPYSSTMERQIFNRLIYFSLPLLSILLFHIAIMMSTSSFSCHILYIITVVPLYLVVFLLLSLVCGIEMLWSLQYF